MSGGLACSGGETKPGPEAASGPLLSAKRPASQEVLPIVTRHLCFTVLALMISGACLPAGAAIRHLSFIDHYNLRYMYQSDSDALRSQTDEIKLNLARAHDYGVQTYILFSRSFEYLVNYDFQVAELGNLSGKVYPYDGEHRARQKQYAAYLEEALRAADDLGIDVIFHANQFDFPDAVYEMAGEKMAGTARVCPGKPLAYELLKGKLREFFRRFPSCDGFQLTLSETQVKITECECESCRDLDETDRFVRVAQAAAEVCGELGKTIMVRSWGGFGDGDAAGLPDNVILSTKNTRGDFHLLKGPNEMLERASDRLEVEFDGWGEYKGYNFFPCYMGDVFEERIRLCAEAGVERLAIRLNWNHDLNHIFGPMSGNEANVHVFHGLARDPEASSDDLLREYLAGRFPAGAREAAFDLYKRSRDWQVAWMTWQGVNANDHSRVYAGGGENGFYLRTESQIGREVPEAYSEAVAALGQRRKEIDRAYYQALAAVRALGESVPEEQRRKLKDGARTEWLVAQGVTDCIALYAAFREVERGRRLPDVDYLLPGILKREKQWQAWDEELFGTMHGFAPPMMHRQILEEARRRGALPDGYVPVPEAAANAAYTVQVNGRPVSLEQAGHVEGAWYLRLVEDTMAGTEVSVSGSGVEEMEYLPERNAEVIQRKDGLLKLRLNGGPLVLSHNPPEKENWPLILLPQRAESMDAPDGARVFLAGDYVTGSGVQTVNLQRALDECAGSGGGTVIFGAGEYVTATLEVGDNTTVFLAPGSLIRASGNPEDYPDEGHLSLIHFRGSRNSALTGAGVIDGTGHILRLRHEMRCHLVEVTDAEYIEISDVVLRNASSWTCHLVGSRGIRIRNLKVLNDWAVPTTDGIDPDSSSDVLVEGYFGRTGDDAVAIKTRDRDGQAEASRNITVRDSVVMTRKTSFKVGTETWADLSNILFENCDAVFSSRGIGVWVMDGASVSDVTFRDIRLDLHEIEGEGWSGEPFRVILNNRGGVGTVRGLRFEDVTARTPYVGFLEGMAESAVRDVEFAGLDLTLTKRQIKQAPLAALNMRHCSGVVFDEPVIRWETEEPEVWNGWLDARDCERVEVRGLREVAGRGGEAGR